MTLVSKGDAIFGTVVVIIYRCKNNLVLEYDYTAVLCRSVV